MKKKLALLIALLVAMTMVFGACGSKDTPAPAPADPPADSGSAAAEPAAPADPADGPQAVEVSLVLTNHDPDTSLAGQWVKEWAAAVAEASNGRIEVQVNNGGSLAKPTESLDKVRDGSVDLAWGLQSFYPGQFPISDGLSLPYLPYKNAAQASQVIQDIWENTDLLQDEYKDVKVIMLRSNCDAPIITSTKKLEKAEDLKGMTLRATAAPIVEWLADFGASGQGCPIGELYQNLKGSFNGAITDWHAIDSFSLYEAAKYFADEQVQYNTYYFLMNLDTYNKLSDENKAAIDSVSGQAALDIMLDAWDDIVVTTKQEITDYGSEVYALPDAEHQKLVDDAAKVTEKWIAANGDKAQQLYDKIVELSK